MGRRVVLIEDREDRPCRLDGVAQLMAICPDACFADGIERVIVIWDRPLSAGHGTTGPVGAERPRFDGGDVDTEGCHFFPDALEQTLDGELACTVRRHAWHGH